MNTQIISSPLKNTVTPLTKHKSIMAQILKLKVRSNKKYKWNVHK